MNVQGSETWAEALQLLRMLAPGADDFIADRIADALWAEGRGVSWLPIPSFGGDDCDVWEELRAHVPVLEDGCEVMLVCDGCYSDGRGPFRLLGVHMRLPLSEVPLELEHDEVFAGDVIILSSTMLALVHHEGFVAVVTT